MTQFEKTFNLMKNPRSIAIYISLVILSFLFVDRPLATYFHQLDFRTNLHVLNLLTILGKDIIYLALFFFAALYFRYIRTNSVNEAKSWYLLACIITANLVCLVIKVTLGRARPDLLFSNDAFGFYWFKLSGQYWSLPSGHTTTVISLAAGFGVLFPKYFYTFLVLAFLIVLTRVLLYYHYLSDVMSAFYISILVIGLLTDYLRRNQYFSRIWSK
jgi:membrane-associated phospholipid phosphatase